MSASDQRQMQFLKEGKDWERNATSILGIFSLRLPGLRSTATFSVWALSLKHFKMVSLVPLPIGRMEESLKRRLYYDQVGMLKQIRVMQ